MANEILKSQQYVLGVKMRKLLFNPSYFEYLGPAVLTTLLVNALLKFHMLTSEML